MQKEEKTKIKETIIKDVNKVLEDKNETHILDNIMIFNNKDFTGFMGNIRVYNPENLNNIKESLIKILEEYGEVAINQQHITPCCELPYDYLSFIMTIK